MIRSNGDVLPTLLVDGYVAGVWRPVDGVIEATAFHPLPDEAWAGLEAEASALLAFLAGRDPAIYRRYWRWWADLPAADVRTPRLMRVLFTCVVGLGHFNPMALARARVPCRRPRRRDRDRSLLRPARPRARLRRLSRPGLDMAVAKRRLYREVPDWRDVAPWDQARHIVRGIFGGSKVEPMLADLEPILRDWRPDLLIHDTAEMAGAIAAEVAGIAHAEHAFGLLRPRD